VAFVKGLSTSCAVTWDGRSTGTGVSPGVYFVLLDSGDQVLRKRIAKIR